MRRKNHLQNRPIRALSVRFLRAPIVEWLFPMHRWKTPLHLHLALMPI